ncbi:MAG: hydrogenase maturation protease [Candidatus Eisenbacteria bacterium]|nr:hydrogenase maturation protease [Candidatus Eisenbacteria bacterium]
MCAAARAAWRPGSSRRSGGSERRMRTLVLGVGNSILSDDAVGLVVARRLEERFGGRDDADFGYNEEAGFTLLEESLGYERLVVVDSILTGVEPGTIHRLDLSDLGRSIHSNSPHGMNLATVMALGRAQGMDVPDDVRIYAIEVIDTLTFGEELTPQMAERVGGIVDEIASEVFGDT